MVLKKGSVSETASKLKVDERLLFAESDSRAETVLWLKYIVHRNC